MPAQADLVFGKIALQNRLLTEGQLQDALQAQEAEALAGEPRQLGEILKARGYLTDAHVHEILRLQKALEIREEDKKYGTLCVRNGFLAEAALKEALEIQKLSARGGNTPRRIGDILVEKGWLTDQQRRAVNVLQKRMYGVSAPAGAATAAPPAASAPAAAPAPAPPPPAPLPPAPPLVEEAPPPAVAGETPSTQSLFSAAELELDVPATRSAAPAPAPRPAPAPMPAPAPAVFARRPAAAGAPSAAATKALPRMAPARPTPALRPAAPPPPPPPPVDDSPEIDLELPAAPPPPPLTPALEPAEEAPAGPSLVCPACSTINQSGAAICASCLAPLGASAPAPATRSPTPAKKGKTGRVPVPAAAAPPPPPSEPMLDLELAPGGGPSGAPRTGESLDGWVTCPACAALNPPGTDQCAGCFASLQGAAPVAPGLDTASSSTASPLQAPARHSRLSTEVIPADALQAAADVGGPGIPPPEQIQLISGMCPLCHKPVAEPAPACPTCGGRVCPKCNRVSPAGIMCTQCGFAWAALAPQKRKFDFRNIDWKDPKVLAGAGGLLLVLVVVGWLVFGGGSRTPGPAGGPGATPGPGPGPATPVAPAAPDDSVGKEPPPRSGKWVVLRPDGGRQEGVIEPQADAFTILDVNGKRSLPQAEVAGFEAPGASLRDPAARLVPVPIPELANPETPGGTGTNPGGGTGTTPGTNPDGTPVAPGDGTQPARPRVAGPAVDLLAGLRDAEEPPPPIDRTVTVVLKDTRRLKGELSERPDGYEIKMKSGKTAVKKAEVVEMEKSLDLQYEERAAVLTPKDGPGHVVLARWCLQNKLDEKAAYEYRQVLRADPSNQDAHRGLGNPQVDNKYVRPADLLRSGAELLAGDKPDEAIKLLLRLAETKEKFQRKTDRFLAWDLVAKCHLRAGRPQEAVKAWAAMMPLGEPGQQEILKARSEIAKASKEGAVEFTRADLAAYDTATPPLKPGLLPLAEDRVMDLAVRREATKRAADVRKLLPEVLASEAVDPDATLRKYDDLEALGNSANCLAADAATDVLKDVVKQQLPFVIAMTDRLATEADMNCPAKTPPLPGERGKYKKEDIDDFQKKAQSFLAAADAAQKVLDRCTRLLERFPDATGDKADALKEAKRKINEVLGEDRKQVTNLRGKIR